MPVSSGTVDRPLVLPCALPLLLPADRKAASIPPVQRAGTMPAFLLRGRRRVARSERLAAAAQGAEFISVSGQCPDRSAPVSDMRLETHFWARRGDSASACADE